MDIGTNHDTVADQATSVDFAIRPDSYICASDAVLDNAARTDRRAVEDVRIPDDAAIPDSTVFPYHGRDDLRTVAETGGRSYKRVVSDLACPKQTAVIELPSDSGMGSS